MDAYYTELGDRPSLAEIEVNAPEGYIGNRLLPVVPTADKSGTIYYATLTADAAAQTGRAAGTAPTSTQISDSSTTFTTAEAVKRGSITPDEAKQMGGIEKADEVGSKYAKRQVQKAIESAQATVILGGAINDTFDVTNAMTQMQTGLQAIRQYPGKTCAVSSTATLKALVQGLLADETYFSIFSRLVTGTSPDVAVQGMSFDAWLKGLAAFFGVDEVLAGDDAVWNDGTNAERMAVCKVDTDPDPISHKYNPVLGKTFLFLPDGENTWQIESVPDRVAKNNHYDATAWYNVVELNAAALYLWDGIA